MTSKEDIIRMARETGIADAFLVTPHPGVVQQLERFAELVRADEREACLVGIQAEIDHAAINDTRLAPSFGKREGALAVRIGALEAALDAIRARGDK